jgi:hypothetical protein
MDLFERLFGMAPDGGSGATEVTYLALLLLAAAAIAWRRIACRGALKRPVR